jgi:hypothetical protein
VNPLNVLVLRAQAGDLDAYGIVVRRFQDMAVGYACAVLGDFHLAEDAAQEAFIEATKIKSRLTLSRLLCALSGDYGDASSKITGRLTAPFF